MNDKEPERFHAGDVIRLNPANENYSYWVERHTAGPFLVLPPSRDKGNIQRLSDGVIVDCNIDITSWWAILDPFLDAAHKANNGKD